VAGTGYIFGAYTAIDWPNQPARGTPPSNVPDPSGASFLFSLINAFQRPFRMSLVDRSCAVRVTSACGPCFGGQVEDADGERVKFCNLLLMRNGKDAKDSRGNASNDAGADMAYQIDAWVDGPPVGFTLNRTTLAGVHHFAAVEIECYSL
jgi:hypothetical protein